MSPYPQEGKEGNSKSNKKNRFDAKQTTRFNNFNSAIEEGALIRMLVYLIHNSAHKIETSRLHTRKSLSVMVSCHHEYKSTLIFHTQSETKSSCLQSNVDTCRNLLTANIYGNVACAEAGTEPFLKTCIQKKIIALYYLCNVIYQIRIGDTDMTSQNRISFTRNAKAYNNILTINCQRNWFIIIRCS